MNRLKTKDSIFTQATLRLVLRQSKAHVLSCLFFVWWLQWTTWPSPESRYQRRFHLIGTKSPCKMVILWRQKDFQLTVLATTLVNSNLSYKNIPNYPLIASTFFVALLNIKFVIWDTHYVYCWLSSPLKYMFLQYEPSFTNSFRRISEKSTHS